MMTDHESDQTPELMTKMAEQGESKTPIQHLIAEVQKDPNYKVLTNDRDWRC